MKKVLALLITVFMLFGTFAVSSSADVKQFADGDATTVKTSYGNGPVHISLMSFSNEVPNMVQAYISMKPEFGSKYTVDVHIVPTDNGMYQLMLDSALNSKKVDIYTAEEAFIYKYAKGDMSAAAATYKDIGIDADNEILDAQIAGYVVDAGTRGSDRKVVALAYQATGSALIYRASIAKEVFGTDDPAAIEKEIGGGTGSYEGFWTAAIKLKDKGYPIVSSVDDIWRMAEYKSSVGWSNSRNKDLTISPERLAFFEYAKAVKQRGWSNETGQWSAGWNRDFAGQPQEGHNNKPAFCFIGPSWLIQYTMKPNCGGSSAGEGTYGDWRICRAPADFAWGGTWIFASKKAASDSNKRDGIAELIRWINLDTSDTGLQYMWANGLFSGNGYTKDCVASAKVLENSDGTNDFLGGQDMYPVYVQSNRTVSAYCMGKYDMTINDLFRNAAYSYASGGMSYEDAMKNFISGVESAVGLKAGSIPELPTVTIPDKAGEPVPDDGGNESGPDDTEPDDNYTIGQTDGPVQYQDTKQDSKLLIIILICAGAGMLVIAGVVVAIILIVSSKKKKAKVLNAAAPQQPIVPQLPVQPVVPQQPIAPQQPVQQVMPAQPKQPVMPAEPAQPAAPVQKRFCPNCGAELKPNAGFCGNCGFKMK